MMTLQGTHLTKETGAPTIRDLMGLVSIFRFGAQTYEPWSVGHHSLVVWLMAKEARSRNPEQWSKLPLHCLLHDAHELMTGDIPTSFKTEDMKALQRKLDVRIYEAFNLPWPTRDEECMVHYYDQEALIAEAEAVTPRATFRRIVQEIGMEPSDFARRAVARVRYDYRSYIPYMLHDALAKEIYPWQ